MRYMCNIEVCVVSFLGSFQWSGTKQRYVVEDVEAVEDGELEGFNIILQPPPVVKFSWDP
jgi:hypothetical protein